MSRNVILTTIINPPLVAGVSPGFALFILTCFFLSVILLRAMFGFLGFMAGAAATLYLYFYARKRTATDPYWYNTVIMAFLFEKKRPLEFITRLFTKKTKTLGK